MRGQEASFFPSRSSEERMQRWRSRERERESEKEREREKKTRENLEINAQFTSRKENIDINCRPSLASRSRVSHREGERERGGGSCANPGY